MKNNIILIGFMGCGKSTIGKLLSKRLECDFVDTDAWIEAKLQTTISNIFATRGEEAFRGLETEALRELLRREAPCVISVGGGLPMREENRRLLQQLGEVIYLQARPDTIYERLKEDTTRPLLQTENPRERIRSLLAEREERYLAAAGKVLMVDRKKPQELVEELLRFCEDS